MIWSAAIESNDPKFGEPSAARGYLQPFFFAMRRIHDLRFSMMYNCTFFAVTAMHE